VNILEDDAIRTGMKEYSQWPTFPQVYIGGEFYGGCDILIGTQNPSSAPTLVAGPLPPSAPAAVLHLR
jgi:glutaredoxin-related protein